MQLFIDTANLEEIKKAKSWGILDGITTNPSLIHKEVERYKAAGQNIDMHAYLKAILQVAGEEVPVSLEVTATNADEMIRQGKHLYQTYNPIANNVVIKIPINTYVTDHYDGLRAIKALYEQEIPVNCTLIFTPEQALLAAKAGAAYVSPFVGRIDDHIRKQAGIEFEKTDYFPAEGWEAEAEEDDEEGEMLDDNGIVSGVDLVTKIVDLFEKHEIECDVIAASIRNPRQVREVAYAGATIATVPPAILHILLDHEKTREGLDKFRNDTVPAYQQVVGGDNSVQNTASQSGSVPNPVTQPVGVQNTVSSGQNPVMQSGSVPNSESQQSSNQNPEQPPTSVPNSEPQNNTPSMGMRPVQPEQKPPSAYDLVRQ